MSRKEKTPMRVEEKPRNLFEGKITPGKRFFEAMQLFAGQVPLDQIPSLELATKPTGPSKFLNINTMHLYDDGTATEKSVGNVMVIGASEFHVLVYLANGASSGMYAVSHWAQPVTETPTTRTGRTTS